MVVVEDVLVVINAIQMDLSIIMKKYKEIQCFVAFVLTNSL